MFLLLPHFCAFVFVKLFLTTWKTKKRATKLKKEISATVVKYIFSLRTLAKHLFK